LPNLKSKTFLIFQAKTEKLKIKVKVADVRPPSIDESVDTTPTPEATDLPPSPPPKAVPDPLTDPVKENERPKSDDVITEVAKLPAEPEKAKPPKVNITNLDEYAKKQFVQRSKIATKNISFMKTKKKGNKYGPPTAGRAGTPDHSEKEGERRQLPSRRSRPQQMYDERDPEDMSDEPCSPPGGSSYCVLGMIFRRNVQVNGG